MQLPVIRVRLVVIALVGAGILIAATAASSAMGSPSAQPVLGTKYFYVPHAIGFGHARPSMFSNGGDPSGTVTLIHWSGWGGAVADGVGQNAISMPGGGYYPGTAPIQLRASDLGDCGDGIRAYLKLEYSVPSMPGGPPGPWTPWATGRNFCPHWATKATVTTADLSTQGSYLCGVHGIAQASHSETVRSAVLVDGNRGLLFGIAARSFVDATRAQAQAVVTLLGAFSTASGKVGIHDRIPAGTKVHYEIICNSGE
jgi:hypothetical protein